MSTIITPSGPISPANLDAARRQRAGRLARVAAGQMEFALAYLSAIDPQMFDIVFDAIDAADEARPEDDEPFPLCRRCGGQVGIFPDRGLGWQHYRGDGITVGAQQILNPGHAPEVAWYTPDDLPDEQ